MADITSVLEIDVKDDAFKALQRELEAFKQSMSELKSAGGVGRIVSAGGGASPAAQAQNRKAIEQSEAFSKSMKIATDSVSKFSAGLVRFTGSMVFDAGKKLSGAFVSLTKTIVGAGGLISSMAGMITLAGIIKSAQTVSQRAYTGTALGLGPNEIPRLQATYGQIFDVGSVTESLAAEREKPGSLLMSRMGLSPDQAKSATMVDLLERYTKLLQELSTMPMGATATMLEAFGMPGAITDVTRVRNLGPERIKAIQQQEREAREATQLENPQEWQSFAAKMGISRIKIETGIMNALLPILQPIKELATILYEKLGPAKGGFIDLVKQAANYLSKFNEAFKTGNWENFFSVIKKGFFDAIDGIKKAGESLFNKMTEFLSGQFDKIFQKFEDNMSIAGKMLIEFSNSTAAKLLGISPISTANAAVEPIPTNPNEGLQPAEKMPQRVGELRGAEYLQFFAESGKKWGVDPRLLWAMAKQESINFTPGVVSGRIKSPAGAIGIAQFMPATAARYNIDPRDPRQSIGGMGHYMHDLIGMFRGDEDKAIASYNWGEGRVLKYGENWREHLPNETRTYLNRVHAYRREAERLPLNQTTTYPMDRQVRVTVQNRSTNADVTVQSKRFAGAG